MLTSQAQAVTAKTTRIASAQSARCTASDLLRWVGMPDEAGASTDALVFGMRRVRTGGVLVHEGAPLESIYVVAAGTFKCVQTDPDGYEQVHEFALRGDMIGFDAVYQDHYATGAVALEDSLVAVVPFRAIAAAARDIPAIENFLLRAASLELARKSMTIQRMAAVGAEVRVARFLLQMAQRQVALGYSGRRLRLRMSRRDIASHLGLAHETVSRSLTALAAWGYIRVDNREIEILDDNALRAFQATTRGTHEMPEVRHAHAMPAGRAHEAPRPALLHA